MKLLLGDCKEKLKELSENSVDAIVTDPPYELGFMGKSWDNTGIANNVDMWKECLRVLKPGGHLLSFGGTRTYHRMACAIEDAGFEIRDMIEWVYGSGFPKSLNIGKAINKIDGVEFESKPAEGVGFMNNDTEDGYHPTINQLVQKGESSERAKEWEGWGTALKPAHEPICMARKPLSEKTVAENVLKHGTGGINIDESRVDYQSEQDKNSAKWGNQTGNINDYGKGVGAMGGKDVLANNQGRFPANLIHDNSEEVRECFPETKSGGGQTTRKNKDAMFDFGQGYSRNEISDSGNASRFFKSIIYTAKASKSERNKGCEGLEEKDTKRYGDFEGTPEHAPKLNIKNTNNHPTVKPVALMEYLITMVSKDGQTILDPFMGSGTTGVACANLSRNFIGIELEPEYMEISKHRIENAEQKPIQLLMEHRVRI